MASHSFDSSQVPGQSSDDQRRKNLELDTQTTALLVVESLTRYYVQATGRLDEQQVRTLLEQAFPDTPLMDTFIDLYIAQGEQRGAAKILLRQIERKFGPPSETIRHQITSAYSETLLEWSERILDAQSLDEVLH